MSSTDIRSQRLGAVAVLCSLVAVWLGSFGASSVGIQLPHMPLAGHLVEKRAVDQYKESITQTNPSAENMERIRQQASDAFANAPLSPAALALLGRANEDKTRQAKLFEYIFNINRRDTILLSSAFETSARLGEIDELITAFDRLIRVSPQNADALLRVLIPTLHDEQSIPTFVKVFAEPKSWSATFLEMAAKDPAALRNAATLRMQIDGSTADFQAADQALLLSLARTGDARSMMQFYNKISADYSGRTTLTTGFGAIDWRAELPPIEWLIKDGQDVRASMHEAEGGLDYYIRSGHGGLLASRTVSAPPEFRLRAEQVLPSEGSSPLRITLKCVGGGIGGTSVALTNAVTISEPIALGSSCAALTIEVAGRVRLGQPSARGRLCKIGFVPLDQSANLEGSACSGA